MAIEAIKGAGMSYQGSSSAAAVKSDVNAKVEASSNASASLDLAKETMAIDTKGTDVGGGGEGKKNFYEQQNEKIKKTVEEINRKTSNSEAIFGIHEGTNRVTIKIVDKSTREVIKEFPPEKTLDMIAKAWEMAGLMVDEKR